MIRFLIRSCMCCRSQRFAGCDLLHLLNFRLRVPIFYFFSHGFRLLLSPLLNLLSSRLLLSGRLVSWATIVSSATSLATSCWALRLILSTEILPFFSLLCLQLLVKKVLRLLLPGFSLGLIWVNLIVRTVIPILACAIPIMRACFFV